MNATVEPLQQVQQMQYLLDDFGVPKEHDGVTLSVGARCEILRANVERMQAQTQAAKLEAAHLKEMWENEAAQRGALVVEYNELIAHMRVLKARAAALHTKFQQSDQLFSDAMTELASL